MKIDPKYYETPFDVLYLPSGGKFYDNEKSSFLIKYLTGREENVLTSPTFHQDGQALRMVLDSVLIEDDINIDELLVCDKDAIILYLRSTSYGDSFPLTFECAKCKNKEEHPLRLSSLEIRYNLEPPDDKGEFSFVLPKRNAEVKFKPMTVLDELELQKSLKLTSSMVYGKELQKTITTRYEIQISSFGGNTNKDYIKKSIKTIPISDSVKLRSYMKDVEPGIQKEITLQCSSCESKYKDELQINSQFLGITPEYRTNIMEEVFLLTYYSKGGISRDEAMRMSVSERRWTINRISEEIEKKNKAEEEAVKKAKK